MAMLQALAKHGISYTIIDGKVTGDARIAAVNEFQDGHAQVMLAQINAAGVAVTLTAAADAVFVQVPWSAGALKQAADRILRVDDRTMARADAGEAITWHVLQAAYTDGDPTFDMAMWDVLERKAHVCDAVNAGKPVTMSEEAIVRAALEAVPAACRSAQARYRRSTEWLDGADAQPHTVEPPLRGRLFCVTATAPGITPHPSVCLPTARKPLAWYQHTQTPLASSTRPHSYLSVHRPWSHGGASRHPRRTPTSRPP